MVCQYSFNSEKNMARFGRKLLVQSASHHGQCVYIASEVKAVGCVPDLVFYLKENRSVSYVVSIEFKLSNWRKAIKQAFTQKNFCNEAYVVMDSSLAGPAISNIMEFKRANIGLATLDKDSGLDVYFYCKPSLPFSAQYSELFSKNLLKRKTIPRNLMYTRTIRGGARLSYLRNFYSESTPRDDSSLTVA